MDTELRPATSATAIEPSASAHLAVIAKAICDLDDLVLALGKCLPRAKPWQRQLSARLADIDGLLQALRMTVALEKSDDEIQAATNDLCVECSTIGLAVAGSRSDPTTKTAVRLVDALAVEIRDAFASARRQVAC